MNIIVKAHHVEITKALKEYAEKKMEKLDHFFDMIHQVTVNLHIEKSSAEADRQVSSAIISLKGTVITAKEASADMYASIDLLLDKLSKQLKKYKEKMKTHKGQPSGHDLLLSSKREKAEPVNRDDDDKRYIPKPMGVEDAAEILADEKLDFLVFRDLKERICVIYPREDGQYGLITT